MATPLGVAPSDHSTRGGKFLTFVLAGEEYGIEILKVREILGLLPITRVPRTPEHIRGVINLRGKVIAIADLRRKFGMPEGEITQQTCILVVQVAGVQIGAIVDSVSEVLDIPAEQIEDPPAFGAAVNTRYILGIGKTGSRVKLLLDIDRVLSPDDAVAAAGAAAA